MALSEEDKKKALQVWGMDKSGGGYTGSLTEEQRQSAINLWEYQRAASDMERSATAQRAAKNAVGVAGNVAGKLKRTFGAAEAKLPRPSQIKMPRPFNSGLYDQLGSYLSEKQKEEDAFLKYRSQMVGNEPFTVKNVGGVQKLIPQYSGETYSYLSQFYRGQEAEYRKLIDQQQESYNEKKQQWDLNKEQNEDNMALWFLQKQQDGDPHAQLYTSWQDYLEAMWDGSIPEERIPEDAKQYLDQWDVYQDYKGSGKLAYYENTANRFGDNATMYQDMSVLADMPEDVFEAFRTYAAGPMTDISIGLYTPMYQTGNQMVQEGKEQYEEARDTVTKYLLSQGHPQGTAQYLMESWKRHEDEIQAVRDARQAEQEVENSRSGGVVQFAKARGAALIGGLEQFEYASSLGLAELLGVDTQDERYHYQNTNADAYRMSMYAEAIDAIQTKKASEIGPEWVGNALATLRGATGSMVDNGIRIAIGSLCGAQGMSLGLMGMSSYGSGYRDAAERGATVEQATAFGAASAMLEIVTEKVSLENLLADKSALTLGQKIKDILVKQPLLEISEEEASFIGGKIADAFIMGNQSENNLRVGELMADGKTWEEAEKEVLKENLAEALQTAFETYLSAGMMSGATYMARGVGTKIRRKTSGIDFAEEGYKHFGKVADLQDLEEQRARLENRNKGNEEALEEIDQEYESARQKVEIKILENYLGAFEEEKQAEEDARNERQASVEAIAEELGPYYKDSFISNYDGETDPEEYRSAYMEYAVWGKISQYQGQDRDTALRDTRGTAGYATQVLSKEAQEEAFDIGRIWARDDQARTTQVQKQLSQEVRQQTGQFTDAMGVLENAPEVKQQFQTIAKETGINIEIVDEDTGFNGSFVASTMSMVLNARYNDNLVQTLGHELMEFVNAFGRNDAQKLRKSLAKWWVNQEGAASVDELVKRYQRSYEKAEGSKTYSQAMDELVNDAIGTLLTTEDGLRKLVEWTENRKQVSPNEQKNILGRAKEFIQKIVDGIKRYLQGKDIPEQLKRFLHMEATRVENLMDQFLKGVETATERARSTGVYVEDSNAGGESHAYKPGTVSEKETLRGIQEVASMEPVAAITGDEFKKGEKDLITQVTEFFQKQNGMVENPQLGDVMLDRKGAKSDIAHGIGRKKAASFAAVPDVLEKGRVVDYQKNWKGRGYDTAVVAAPVTIAGEAHLMGIVLNRSSEDNQFYVHEVTTTKEGATPFKTGTREGNPSGDTPSVISILQKILSVKDGKQKSAAENQEDAKHYSLPILDDDLSMFGEEAEQDPEREKREERLRIAQENFAAGREAREEYLRLVKDLRQAEKNLQKVAAKATIEERAEVDEAIQKLSEAAEELVKYRKSLTKPNTGKTFDDAVMREARRFKKSYFSQMDENLIAEGMKRVRAAIETEGYGGAVEVALETTREMTKQAWTTEGSMYEQYGDTRKYYRDTTIYISRETADEITDFKDFRKRNMGRMRIAIAENRANETLDRDFQEMMDMAPGLLNHAEDMAQSDKLYAIEDALDTIYSNRGVNPYTEYGGLDMVAREAAVEMVQAVSGLQYANDTPMSKLEKKLKEQAARAKEEADAKIKMLQQQVAELQNIADMGITENYNVMRQLEQSKQEKQAAEQKLEDYRNKRNQKEEMTRLRKKIAQTASRLTKYVTENSAKDHVPADLREPIAELMLSLDLSSVSYIKEGDARKADKKYHNAMHKLERVVMQAQKNAVAEDGGFIFVEGSMLDLPRDIYSDLAVLSDNVKSAIDEYEEKGTSTFYLQKMNLSDLKLLDKVLTEISTAVMESNQILGNNRNEGISDLGASAVQELDTLGERKKKGEAGEWLNKKLNWDQTTPVYAFRKLGQAAEVIWEGLTKGWGKLARNLKTIVDFSEATYKTKELNEWEGNVREYTTKEGKTIRLTDAQIMTLVLLMRRKQASGHIMAGGIRIGEFKDGSKTGGGTTHYLIDWEDYQNLRGMLSKRQLEVADQIQKFMQNVGSRWGNAVTMRRFGINAFEELNYFPIRTDGTDHTVDPSSASGMYRLLNLSFTKSTVPNANTAVILDSVFDVYTSHMSDMARYNALALPLLDAMKWYNYRNTIDLGEGKIKTETVKRSMERAYGVEAGRYFLQLMKDMNGTKTGERTADAGLARKMMASYKVAAVGANLRVAILQPTAYLRAAYVLDSSYMAAAFRRGDRGTTFKQETEDMLANCDEAVWKSMGFRDVNIGPGMSKLIKQDYTKKDRLVEWSMVLAEKGDEKTWTRLWIACKLQAASETKQDYRSKETKTRAAELFRDVIYRTQVMDSTLTRSQGMREGTMWSSMVNAFASEPTLSLNILRDAASQYNENVRKYGRGEAWVKSKKTILKAIGAYSASSIMAAVAESLIDAARDDDEYATFLEKYLNALVGDKFLDGNIFGELNPAGKVPFLKDIVSLLQGYKPDRMDLAVITQGIKVVWEWYEYFGLKFGFVEQATELTNYGRKTEWGMAYDSLKFVSQMLGVPVSNAAREVQSAYNTAATLYNDTFGTLYQKKLPMLKTYNRSTESSIASAYRSGYLTYEEAEREITGKLGKTENEAYWMINQWETGMKKTDLLDLAVLEQDGELIEAELERLMSHTDGLKNEGDRNKQQEAYMKASILRTYKDGLLDQKDRYKLYDGKSLTRDQAAEMLQEWTGMSETEIFGELTKKEYEAKNGAAEGYSPFNALFEAMKNGEDLQPYYAALIAEGYEQKDLEEKAIRQVQIWYRDLDLSWEEAAEMLEKNFGITDKKELYKFFTKADYEMAYGNTKGYSEYESLHNIVRAGGDISSEIRYLTENGYTEKEVRDAAVKEVKRLFVGKDLAEGEKKLSLTEAQRYLEKYGRVDENGVLRELDEDEVYWKLEEWKYYEENRNNENVKPWSKFLKLYQAVEDGAGLGDAISYYRKADIDKDDLGKQVEGHFKDIYMELLNTDPNKAEILALHIIDALDSLGLSKYKAKKVVKGWEEEAEEEKK